MEMCFNHTNLSYCCICTCKNLENKADEKQSMSSLLDPQMCRCRMGGIRKYSAKLNVSYGSGTRLRSSLARDLGSPGLCRQEEDFQGLSLASEPWPRAPES